MAKVKTYTLTLDAQELHDLIEAALVCECQAAQIINGLKRKGLDLDAQKLVTQNASLAARQADAGSEEGDSMTNFGKTVRKRLIDLDKTQDWLAAQVKGMGIPCDKTYISKILNGARKGKQVKAAIEKILDLEGGALGG